MAKRQSHPETGMAPKAEQILQGAIEEFLAHGFAATSMDRVAKTAGVSKATLYNHFGDKESLFSALTEYLGEKRILDFVIEEPEDPAIFLKTWATAIFNQILNDPELLCFLRLIIGESGRFPELAQAFIRNVVKVGINRLTKSLESYPQLRLADAEVTARVIMGALLHYLLIQEIMHGEEIMPMERDRYIEGLVKLVITD
ncbi:MAG: TetR/AcrR family transcriptional regulator [Limnospira sp. PMC 1291.21]|uniref:Transcriptional regulator, TetR family n=1 Tax=Limnospira indica PCC 8005 TaxID=376219 RepID=A0A9P1KGG8_9CYAN|nr:MULTISPECIES: TetR/AcrR family transcriptional regulator [Limnospira]MDT9176502.1 TetR/AcrR family transcriptional regulator [Limnospira sp. PMC 1238.20]MDT9191863.1 TetR/AcrR family transcriptional regulator [Limnospira sp. PMC 1245.20]MDT9202078.1 TetR/AcrR family transcriptional regulator [Limnospira sp. PMC 1243.20]MDT9207252.1 TetR/AcrR family transcriptional regulator [Limnospira sp. PMC 1252.20]MDT9212496.1 TetR/AcrR family transcriptional regulator [Limnospira sp. PMC 1256.20]